MSNALLPSPLHFDQGVGFSVYCPTHFLLRYSFVKPQSLSLSHAQRSCRTLLKSASSHAFKETSESPDIIWDDLGFHPVPTDFMYVIKCCGGHKFSDGGLYPFEPVELNPFSSVLNYGQGLIEGLKAYKKENDSILLFRPEMNALRMRLGADRLCMPAPTIDQFVEAVKATVLANARWIPPPDKGFLHIRPILIGSGPVLSLTTSPEFTFLIYVTPVRNYFEGGVKPINLVAESEVHRAVPGGVGSVKAIGNYAAIMKTQAMAKTNGFDDVLFLDSVHKKYLEEISTANIFIVKDKAICTPALRGTILPGVTRESVTDIARWLGFQVEERLIAVQELFGADEVFVTSNAIGLVPVNSITYINKRISYRGGDHDSVSQQLCSTLANVQKGLIEDKMGWTVRLSQREN